MQILCSQLRASYLFSHSSVELVYAFDVDYIHDPATVPAEFTRMLRSFPQQVIKVLIFPRKINLN
jgi:hypothetical protein